MCRNFQKLTSINRNLLIDQDPEFDKLTSNAPIDEFFGGEPRHKLTSAKYDYRNEPTAGNSASNFVNRLTAMAASDLCLLRDHFGINAERVLLRVGWPGQM